MLHELRCHGPIWNPLLAHPSLATCDGPHEPQRSTGAVAQLLVVLSFAAAHRSHQGICSSTCLHSIAIGGSELLNGVPWIVDE